MVKIYKENKLNKGDIIHNAGETFEVLDQNKEDTLLVGLDKDGNRKDRYIVAWHIQPDNSWGQGHYYNDEKSARSAFDRRSKKQESLSSIDGPTYVFKVINKEYWGEDWPFVKDFDGKRCKVTGTAVKGPDFKSSYHDIEFEDGNKLEAISAIHLRPVTESKSTDERCLTESEYYNHEGSLCGREAKVSNELPPSGNTWIKLHYDGKYNADYFVFKAPYIAQEVYKEVVSGECEVDNIHDIALGFTDTTGGEQIRWLDYADNFSVTDKAEDKELITESEISEDPTPTLSKIGYKQTRNKDGEILYTSDVLYSPDISVFGSIIEIIPLSSDDLPISMTIEDHGKLVLRLAEVQKAVEDLK